MASRRQILENALSAERANLWHDLRAEIVGGDPSDNVTHVQWLIRRIRSTSEALGYPSDPESLQPDVLAWYLMVESCAALGIAARFVDFDELDPRDASTVIHPGRWERGVFSFHKEAIPSHVDRSAP